jgi:ABC-type dipeptide/oligopeptide/nickel transport system permease component
MCGPDIVDFFWTTEEEHAQIIKSLEELKNNYGLNGPNIVQYANWLGRIFKGNFGTGIFSY